MQTPRYITQLDGNWINNVTRAANLTAGKGLKIEKSGDKTVISFDEDIFKLMIYAILDKTCSCFSYVVPAEYTLDYSIREENS